MIPGFRTKNRSTIMRGTSRTKTVSLSQLTILAASCMFAFQIMRVTMNTAAKNEIHTVKSVIPVSPLAWTQPFTGNQFHRYKESIDQKIIAHRESIKHEESCEMDLYDGEYGYELAGILPWAYYKSQKCQVKTKGRPGTKYLYYFSKEHTVQSSKEGIAQRSSHKLPKDSPFGESPHFHDKKFPKSGWLPPPYKEFFKRDDLGWNKPLLILSNKYTMEWSDGPVNHIPIDTLRQILNFLTPNYHIVYNRFKDSRLEDRLEQKISNGAMTDIATYEDKEMIKRFFPSVVLFEELSSNLETEDVNLLMFSLGASANKFISVQGGNSVVASFFGRTNIIYAVKGPEVNWKSENGGDFTYYHRFSDAKIHVKRNAAEFCKAVVENTIEDPTSIHDFCTATQK